MNYKHLLLLPILFLFLVSCSDDDDSSGTDQNGNQPNPENLNYFPMNSQNTWTYNDTYQPEGESAENGTENLMVEDSTATGTTFSSTTDHGMPGLVTHLLTKGSLKKDGGKLYYSGHLKVNVGFGDSLALAIPIQNMVVYDKNADAGTQLFTVNDSINEEVVFGDLGTFTLHFEYTLTSKEMEATDNFSVGDQTFGRTLASSFTLTLSGMVEDFNFPLIDEHDVIVSENHYAGGVGLVKSENVIDIPIKPLPEGVPGVPDIESIKAESSQKISSYEVN